MASHLTKAIAISPAAQGALQEAAAVHGYTTGFWWTAGFFAGGAIVCGALFRRGPLARQAQSLPAGSQQPQPAPGQAPGQSVRT